MAGGTSIPPREAYPWLNERTILYTKAGSFSYGTNIATSDEDFKGVCVPPQIYRDGFRKSFEQAEFNNGIDAVIYDIQKFFRLASKANPNILEVLFVDDADILVCTSAGSLLRQNRYKFLSKKAFKSYSGYAASQVKKMRTHKSDHPERRKLHEKYGYDTKYAMHLIRLLRTCTELLTDGEIYVKRPDARELIAIRNGSLTEAELIGMVLELETKNAQLVKTSILPDEPNYEELDELCVQAIGMTERIHG